jgi:hypothetical protein
MQPTKGRSRSFESARRASGNEPPIFPTLLSTQVPTRGARRLRTSTAQRGRRWMPTGSQRCWCVTSALTKFGNILSTTEVGWLSPTLWQTALARTPPALAQGISPCTRPVPTHTSSVKWARQSKGIRSMLPQAPSAPIQSVQSRPSRLATKRPATTRSVQIALNQLRLRSLCPGPFLVITRLWLCVCAVLDMRRAEDASYGQIPVRVKPRARFTSGLCNRLYRRDTDMGSKRDDWWQARCERWCGR